MSVSTFQLERTTINGALAEGAPKAPAGHGASRFPSLTTTVPKELVHRAAVAEVMLTDWRREDDTCFAMAGQWPRGHSFFTPVGDGYHDPLIAAETIRQAGILLAHAEFGAPLDLHFLVSDLDVAVRLPHFRVGDAPASLDITVTCPDVRRRGSSLAGMRIEAEIRRDGHVAATGGGSLTCITPPVYRRLRSRRATGTAGRLPLTAPTAPQRVGRMSPTDVVLTPIAEAGRWQLRVDTRHPVLFDHPVDHVPGMLLMEAARQAAAATLEHSSFVPLSMANEFRRYVELDEPCLIEARRLPRTASGDDCVLVTGHQDAHVVFQSTVTASAGPTAGA
ncbi:ScbA/BarX family gamma-butyrolactone biosynthesis protein [Streptomyces sp. 4N124]|uniref:ScbA/BarX family gamma-butyrolactone biosynthesis protein n=1 Tax=Streptomyces sp. 4N124 TaxID=3457420 RepID=UPI003FD0B838